MPQSDEFLPLSQAARRVGMTEVAIRRRVRRGDLVAFADPRDLRVKLVRVADLEAYVTSRRTIPAAVGEDAMPNT
jgi:hypothetical protein